MTTNLGPKIFRQIPRSFVAAGTGGNLRSSTDLAAARSKARSRHSSNKHRRPSSMTLRQLNDALPDVRYWIPVVAGVWWFDKTMEDSAKASAKASTSELMKRYHEGSLKIFERRGVSREHCEAEIAKLKRKMESGSASEDDSRILDMYEGWLRVFTKDE